jgi:hypothetical protein
MRPAIPNQNHITSQPDRATPMVSEESYLRKRAQFARAHEKIVVKARVNTVMSGLENHLHGGSEPMKRRSSALSTSSSRTLFNREFKQRRLAGLIKSRYGVAKNRFQNHLADHLIDGVRGGALMAAIEAALS